MNSFFIESLDAREHPIKKAKKRIQTEYITALTFVINKTINKFDGGNNEINTYIHKRINLYQSQLSLDVELPNHTENQCKRNLTTFAKPWRAKYRYMLICDIALILVEEKLVSNAINIVKEYLSLKNSKPIDYLSFLLKSEQEIEKKYRDSYLLIEQYRANNRFFSEKEYRLLVTANISTGKSTLINALVGKPIARTSQEVCTGNVCYLYNKSHEDDNISLFAKTLKLDATADDIYGYDWNQHISIATYFNNLEQNCSRLCIIDTPGVDAALYKEHSERAHNALLNEKYGTLIYVVSPTRLGTDAEKKHLQWITKYIHDKKIIFVLNKLDDYHCCSDSIKDSIMNFKNDLINMGFKKPIICPISAYFSYLIKLKLTGQDLSDDEMDEYILLSKKFKKIEYDLSNYYEGIQCLPTDSEEIELSKRAGLYGLEKMLYGGTV